MEPLIPADLLVYAAYAGYALLAGLILLTCSVVGVVLTADRRDDGYRWVGVAEPPPEPRSPFASPRREPPTSDEVARVPRQT